MEPQRQHDIAAETFPITGVEGDWFRTLTWIEDMVVSKCEWKFILSNETWDCTEDGDNSSLIAFIRDLYEKRIGEIACKWPDGTSIKCNYAMVKLGDIFDFYTTKNETPKWKTFEYAVEDYLTNDPRLKFNPSRVAKFIEKRGLDSLEDIQ